MKLFCITGMHRSGTSLAARIANLSGLHLGPDERLLGPAQENPKGFWEQKDIKDLNDRILRSLGGDWSHPPVIQAEWFESQAATDFTNEALVLVNTLFSGRDVAGWKDPRTSILLPFWQNSIGLEGTVLVIRHPLEVSQSLQARDHIGPELAAELWLQYTIAAFVDDPGALVLDYDAVLSAPVEAAHRMCEYFGTEEINESASQEIEGFAESRLRHHHAATIAPETDRVATAVTVYELMRHGGADEFRPLFVELRRAWAGQSSSDAADEELEFLQTSARRAKARFEEANQNVRRLRSRLEATDDLARNLKARVEHEQREAAALKTTLDRRHEQLLDLQAQLSSPLVRIAQRIQRALTRTWPWARGEQSHETE